MSPSHGFEAVDAHHHLWDLSRLTYPWLEHPDPFLNRALGDYRQLRVNYLAEDLLLQYTKYGFKKSVHVEAACSDPRAETLWLMETANLSGLPDAIVVRCDLTSPDAPAELEWQASHSRVRGVRTQGHPEEWNGREFKGAFRTLVDLGFSYELNASPPRLKEAAELATWFPDARIVVGHVGAPLQRDPDYFAMWKHDLRRAAEGANVWVKLSGLGMADHTWSVDSISPWVLEAIDAFGPSRCMFGTNWPVDSLYSGMERLIVSYQELLQDLTAHEQASIFGRNAESFYRI